MKIVSVACFQPGGIHVYRRQIVQCSKIVPHLCVITPQELVGCSGHVDVEGLALTTLSVKELKYRFVLGRTLQVYLHNIEKGFTEIWRAALGRPVAPNILISGLVGHGINTGKRNESLLPFKTAYIANFRALQKILCKRISTKSRNVDN